MRVPSLLRFSAAALAVLFGVNVVSPAATNGSQSRPLITAEINESNLVTLTGNTRPEANAANDRGPVSGDLALEHMFLQLRRAPERESALQRYIADLQNPNSQNYHQWLTAQQLGERYGLAQSDLNTITRWLEGKGFKVNVVYPSGMVIDFSGTAAMVREAFHTEIHQLMVDGKKHIANISDPRIPAALAPAVMGVVSLNDFRPHRMYKPKSQYTATIDGFTYYLVAPADLATIYNLNPLFSEGTTGKGQTVVVVEDTNMNPADFTTFRSALGLSGYASGKLQIAHPSSSGNNNCMNPGINGDGVEASLDAEWASAAAPDATIKMISCASSYPTFGGLIAIQNLLNAVSTPASIMSMSYGVCEAFTGATENAAFNSAFQQAASEGVSVFVSAGDDAAAGCDRDAAEATHGIQVTGWGDTPYNVAVGGTDFGDSYLGENSTYWSSTNGAYYESALSYLPEIPWNDSCASVLIATVEGYSTTYGADGFCNSSTGSNFLNTIGGSGGPSDCATGSPAGKNCKGYAKPSWQMIVGNPNDGVRDIPDVSLFAANGVWGHFYPFCDSAYASCAGAPDTWLGGGGTSFSSPIMAGIQALVNQKNGSRQGNVNVAYYALANAEYGATGNSGCSSTLGNAASSNCVFYDVTLGDMDVPCTGVHDCYTPSGSIGVLSTSDHDYQPAYPTTTGWDFGTGIGTVNATNLVNQWSTVAPRAAGDR
ncbi:MAG TPA: S53 family peptidase [Candidatus Acidoferrales bacterium]|nr:S53 family peptidase [Candidatus Acidoferrales bacterium]